MDVILIFLISKAWSAFGFFLFLLRDLETRDHDINILCKLRLEQAQWKRVDVNWIESVLLNKEFRDVLVEHFVLVLCSMGRLVLVSLLKLFPSKKA